MNCKIILKCIIIIFLCLYVHTESFSQNTSPAEWERIRKARESDEARRRQQAQSQEIERQKKANTSNKTTLPPVKIENNKVEAYKPPAITIYDEIKPAIGIYRIVILKDKWGIIDNFNVVVVPLKYDYLQMNSSYLIGAIKNNKWGFITTTGEVVIDFEFDAVLESFEYGNHPLVRKGGFEFRINNKGETVSEKIAVTKSNINVVKTTEVEKKPVVTELKKDVEKAPVTPYDLFEGLGKTELNGKWGFRDETGKMVVPAIYEDVIRFKRGVAAVLLKGYWGYINKQGKMIVPNKYLGFGYLDTKENLLAAKASTGWGVINFNGLMVVPFKYDLVYPIIGTDKLISVKSNGKWGCLNGKGIVVIPVKYDNSLFFWKGNSKIELDNKWGLVNENGKLVVPLIYEAIRLETVIMGKLNNQWEEIRMTKSTK